MKRLRRRKCRCCHTLFKPDSRNLRHQRYCSKTPCRQASKAQSQQLWLSKKENRDYFRGPEQVARVQAWRQCHPGYSRNKTASPSTPLQDVSSTQPIDNQKKPPTLKSPSLQESLFAEPAVLLGLIAHLSGLALQEDIADTSHRLLRLGRHILAGTQPGAPHDPQTTDLPTTT